MKVKVKVGSDVILDTSKKQVSKVLPPDSIIQPPKKEEPVKVLPKIKDRPKDAIFNKVTPKKEIEEKVEPVFTIEVPVNKLEEVVESESQSINNKIAIDAATKYTESTLDTPVDNIDEEPIEVEETTVVNNEPSDDIMERVKALEEAVNVVGETDGFSIADMIGDTNLDVLTDYIHSNEDINVFEESGAKSYTDEVVEETEEESTEEVDESEEEPTIEEQISSWTDKDTGIIASLEECGFMNTDEEEYEETSEDKETPVANDEPWMVKYDEAMKKMDDELEDMERELNELEEDYDEYSHYISNRDRKQIKKSIKQNKSNNDFSDF